MSVLVGGAMGSTAQQLPRQIGYMLQVEAHACSVACSYLRTTSFELSMWHAYDTLRTAAKSRNWATTDR